MKQNKTFLVIVVAIALVVFVGMMLWSKQTAKEEVATIVNENAELLIKPHSPIKGNKDAKVTITEFLDPECEACRAMHPIVKQLLNEYNGKIKFVIRYMPLHGNSKLAASALEEAREQGKYDEALDILFEKQPDWADHHQPRPELIPLLLERVGVKKETLENSAVMSKHAWKVDLDHADGMKLGVRRTPTFFVNGEMLSEIGYGSIKQAIEKALQSN